MTTVRRGAKVPARWRLFVCGLALLASGLAAASASAWMPHLPQLFSAALTPDPDAVDVAALARDVVELAARSDRGASDVKVEYDGPASPVWGLCDSAQMRQVLWNLVRNAVQASGAGKTVIASGLSITGAVNGTAPVYGYQLASTTASGARMFLRVRRARSRPAARSGALRPVRSSSSPRPSRMRS